MAFPKTAFLGATAVAALIAVSPLGVTSNGPSLQTAWADNGDKGGNSGRDGGRDGGRSGSADSADAGKAGGGGNSAAGTNPSGTEGNQGNKGTMGNAGGSFAGSTPGSGGVTTDDDDDDDDTQIGEKPKDVNPPMGNAFGHRDRQGMPNDEAHARAANVLGNLNAAHASPQARANASPNSMVGQIAAYEDAIQQARGMTNATQRDAAIIAAREQLARAANKPLTADVIAQVDAMLGITDVSPQLGALR